MAYHCLMMCISSYDKSYNENSSKLKEGITCLASNRPEFATVGRNFEGSEDMETICFLFGYVTMRVT